MKDTFPLSIVVIAAVLLLITGIVATNFIITPAHAAEFVHLAASDPYRD